LAGTTKNRIAVPDIYADIAYHPSSLALEHIYW